MQKWHSGNEERSCDPYDYCGLHNNRRHGTEECRIANKESQEVTSDQKRRSLYQPNFKCRQFSFKATLLIINNTEIDHVSDLKAWIVDSEANAYISEHLHNYREYSNQSPSQAVLLAKQKPPEGECLSH